MQHLQKCESLDEPDFISSTWLYMQVIYMTNPLNIQILVKHTGHCIKTQLACEKKPAYLAGFRGFVLGAVFLGDGGIASMRRNTSSGLGSDFSRFMEGV